ncbi:uncharacterized protein LOC62_03G005061 [Vanrija pseudolonga]|uniref:N-acetyltransferase domain-containing protein n=1 Tax=Vanrija pseudolonga TaxID=143232 RepID=A0AAF1BKX9_9TREE|nr:hypothetical protein LOC62_03G005061 [Vanrija pseudolonga]
MPPAPTLQGDNGIVLSALHQSDLGSLHELYAANESSLNIPSPYTAADAKATLDSASSEGTYFWAIRSDNKLVGTVALRFTPGAITADLGGIVLASTHRGTGLATAAARLALAHAWDVGFDAVEWECLADNRHSVALAQRLGFGFYREGVSSSSLERYRGVPAVWGVLRRPSGSGER